MTASRMGVSLPRAPGRAAPGPVSLAPQAGSIGRLDRPRQSSIIGAVSMPEDDLAPLERRLGRGYARQRLGIESDLEARAFGHGRNFFHIENWYAVPSVI